MKHLSSALVLLLALVSAAPANADDRLDRALRSVAAASDPLRAAAERGFAVRDDRVQVVALTSEAEADALAGWLERSGARFVVVAGGRVQAFVPPALLGELDRRPEVRFVERPLYAVLPETPPAAAPRKLTTLAVTSEGLEPMNAGAWQGAGFAGAGVRVGVVDIEFGGWEELLGLELPPADRTTYRSFGGASSTADQVHGTACAEIVHDVAPEADLRLAHIRTLTDLFAALDWFAAEGVDVVSMSIGWYGAGPGDGTGDAADFINAFVAGADAPFLNSAGNDRRSHWQGASADGDGNGWVDFAPGDDLNELTLTMSEGDRVGIALVWADWVAPTSDYDLRLYRLGGAEPEEVAVSDRPQTGQSWQSPYEQISYTAPEGGTFAVRIGRTGVAGSHDMELFSLDSDISNRVGEGSVTLPTDAAEVIGVAAVNYLSPYTLRSYSSAGPTNGPGGTLSGGVVKPDLAAYDGVSTVSYGTRSFFGTSAAAPHAAGAAALVRSAEPGWDQAEVRDFLESRALDHGPSGKDNDTGWGRVFLGEAPGSSCTFSLSPTSATIAATGGGGTIQLTTGEGCPWSASSPVEWISIAPSSGAGPRLFGFTVDPNPGPPRTATLTIAGLGFVVDQAAVAVEHVVVVAGIAETEGLAGTRWRSDLAMLNPGPGAAEVELTYRHGSGAETASLEIAAGALVELVNVAVDTFGVADSGGAVEVRSDAPLVVTARTYNDTPDGTFGQFLPGVGAADGLAGAEVAVLSQLTEGDDFRTNIGFSDLGGGGAQLRVRLLDGDGAAVGSPLVETVPAGGWAQRNRVFRAAGAGDCSGCYALVEVISGGPVWAYASVVDSSSGDPTTVPMAPDGGPDAERFLVAGVAETDGANQTRWKTNLALLNRTGGAVGADLVYRYAGGSAETSVVLGDGELREFLNIAGDLFGEPGSAGAVDVEADGALLVTARTFNDSADGTFGQFLPGLDVSHALSHGSGGLLSQLKSTDAFRTNIGFTNYGETDCTVRTFLNDDAGVRKGVVHATVPAGGWTQLNRVFDLAGVGECPLGWAEVEVLTGGCRVWAYASVVDNGSGDPTTIPVVPR